MRLRSILATAALVTLSTGALAVAPTCSSTTGWGSLGPPGLQGFGNAFSTPGSYTDCFSFTLGSTADALGITVEWDMSPTLNIDVSSVGLYSGDSLLGMFSTAAGTKASFFTFSGLSGGIGSLYTLAISSVVTGVATWGPVGYLGAIATIAAPVPEPSTYALMLAGVVGVAGAVWRRRRA
jgi:hypothetical protein